MNNRILVFLVAGIMIFTGCNSQNSELESLKAENEQLRAALQTDEMSAYATGDQPQTDGGDTVSTVIKKSGIPYSVTVSGSWTLKDDSTDYARYSSDNHGFLLYQYVAYTKMEESMPTDFRANIFVEAAQLSGSLSLKRLDANNAISGFNTYRYKGEITYNDLLVDTLLSLVFVNGGMIAITHTPNYSIRIDSEDQWLEAAAQIISVEEIDDSADSGNSGEIEYKIYETETSDIIVTLENTTGKTLAELGVEVTFMNGADMVSVENKLHYAVPSGAKCVYPVLKPRKESFTEFADYDGVEVRVIAKDGSSIFEDASADLSLSHNKGAKDIIIKATNNGSLSINRTTLYAVFYNGDQVVGASLAISVDEIKPGQSITLDACFPYSDATKSNVNFDRYEVWPVEVHR